MGDENSKIDCAKSMCLPQKEEMIVVFVFVVQCLTQHAACTPSRVWGWFVSWVCVGGFSVEGTPGPVPIPVAKLDCADGTAIVGLWESKTPPTHQNLISTYVGVGCVRACPGKTGRPPHTPLSHALNVEKRQDL